MPTSRTEVIDAAVDANLGSARSAAGARAKHEVRDRRDARQRLAAKTERPDRAQIVSVRYLARGVALERQPGVLRLHSLAIVVDANQLLAAELDGNRDAPGTGVERVLDELLDDGSRTFDDFAGGNLIREVGRQTMNAGHREWPVAGD